MLNVVFYSESPVFGGNEKGAVGAHRAALRQNSEIQFTWIINPCNQRLSAALDELGEKYVGLDPSPEFKLLRNPVTVLRKSLRVARVLRTLRADLVLIMQGWILDSYDGVFAARLAGVPYCSYIPMTHSPVEVAVHRLPQLRAAAHWLFYQPISRYITHDDQQAERLGRWNPRAKVAVIRPYVLGPVAPVNHTAEAKRRLGMPGNLPVLGVVGRVEFRQKAQDWLVKALGSDSFLQDKVVAFVGDGPDHARLTELASASRWAKHIFLLGWHNDMKAFHDALDVLVIPSRMEATPWVMIDALARRIPVVGTDRDGMRVWLPPEWRFPFQDANALKLAIENALQPRDEAFWDNFAPRLEYLADERNLGRDFANAIVEFCASAQRRATKYAAALRS